VSALPSHRQHLHAAAVVAGPRLQHVDPREILLSPAAPVVEELDDLGRTADCLAGACELLVSEP